MNEQNIIIQNHTNLRRVLEAVRASTFSLTTANMADKMLSTIGGCTSSRLVGVSADRGLPHVGYAKDSGSLYSIAGRKVATIGKFYLKYVDQTATASQVEAFTVAVLHQAARLGYDNPADSCDW